MADMTAVIVVRVERQFTADAPDPADVKTLAKSLPHGDKRSYELTADERDERAAAHEHLAAVQEREAKKRRAAAKHAETQLVADVKKALASLGKVVDVTVKEVRDR